MSNYFYLEIAQQRQADLIAEAQARHLTRVARAARRAEREARALARHNALGERHTSWVRWLRIVR